MVLPIPVVGVDPGPDYATDVNNCLTIIDGHNHSAGYGVQITPDGLDINSDLPINVNNLTLVRTVRFSAQSAVLVAPTDIGCLYEVGVDLYYNDGAGNNVRITQSGGVAGSPGSIANLTSPASASYVSANQTFVWQSAANTPANLDAASVIFRNLTANSKGLTLNPPAAMGSDYALTLPSLPASQKFMTLDASGNISAPWSVDNSTIQITSNLLNVITVPDGAITPQKLAPLGQQVSSSCGSFSTSALSPADVTNLSVTITTTGRPVFIGLIYDGSGSLAALNANSSGATQEQVYLITLRNSTTISATVLNTGTSTTFANVAIPPTGMLQIDVISAGTYTYKVQMYVNSPSATGSINAVKLIAYEL